MMIENEVERNGHVQYLHDAELAEDWGYATFNKTAPHICVDLPDQTCTISVRTPDGKKVTFAFIQRPGGVAGHQCVDIVHHSDKLNASGNPLQTASLLGQGPVNASANPTDSSPTTMVVLGLPQ